MPIRSPGWFTTQSAWRNKSSHLTCQLHLIDSRQVSYFYFLRFLSTRPALVCFSFIHFLPNNIGTVWRDIRLPRKAYGERYSPLVDRYMSVSTEINIFLLPQAVVVNRFLILPALETYIVHRSFVWSSHAHHQAVHFPLDFISFYYLPRLVERKARDGNVEVIFNAALATVEMIYDTVQIWFQETSKTL